MMKINNNINNKNGKRSGGGNLYSMLNNHKNNNNNTLNQIMYNNNNSYFSTSTSFHFPSLPATSIQLYHTNNSFAYNNKGIGEEGRRGGRGLFNNNNIIIGRSLFPSLSFGLLFIYLLLQK